MQEVTSEEEPGVLEGQKGDQVATEARVTEKKQESECEREAGSWSVSGLG